jgi:hypothetical protein
VTFDTDFKDIDPRIASVLTNVFRGIGKLSGEFALNFNEGKLGAVHGKTDFGEVVGKAFVDAFGVEVAKIREKALALLAEATEEPQGEARASARAFETEDGGNVAALRKSLADLSGILDSDGAKLDEKFEALSRDLNPDVDPKAQAEAQNRRLDGLGERLASARAKNGKDHEAQIALLNELTGLLKGEKERTGSAEKDLKTEIKRLKELLKKAVPF